MRNDSSLSIGLGLLVASALGATDARAATHPSYSFVVVGCNRLGDADTAGSPSTANLPALNRLLTEVADLSPRPDYLFFAGDLVLGYTKDTVELQRQLSEWLKVYKASPLASTSTQLVVIAGNHETQDKKAGKKSFAAAERTWLSTMGEYIVGDNGPVADSTHGDSLTTDQSRLTYSIDHAGDHFVLVDTDPVGRDWRVPTNWIDADIKAARTAGARHVFVIGHKPAWPGAGDTTDGLSKYPVNRDAFWTSLEENHVEAMFASHVHSWQKFQPHAGKTWQIIAGNGGSQWDSIWVELQKPDSTYQGWTLVKVDSSGSIQVESWGHDVENGTYYMAHPERPTVLKDSVDITWGLVPTRTTRPVARPEGFTLSGSGTNLAISWIGPAGVAPVASLRSIEGRAIQSPSFANGQAGWTARCDLSVLSRGSYVLDLSIDGRHETHAIVVR